MEIAPVILWEKMLKQSSKWAQNRGDNVSCCCKRINGIVLLCVPIITGRVHAQALLRPLAGLSQVAFVSKHANDYHVFVCV